VKSEDREWRSWREKIPRELASQQTIDSRRRGKCNMIHSVYDILLFEAYSMNNNETNKHRKRKRAMRNE